MSPTIQAGTGNWAGCWPCPSCGGMCYPNMAHQCQTGRGPLVPFIGDTAHKTAAKCPVCDGEGEVSSNSKVWGVKKICHGCGGKGWVAV